MTTTDVNVLADSYTIALTIRPSLGMAGPVSTVYFREDRPTAHNGRLQTEFWPDAVDGFKTLAGARKAIQRLLAKGVIKASHDPRVVRYTKSLHQRYETIREERAPDA